MTKSILILYLFLGFSTMPLTQSNLHLLFKSDFIKPFLELPLSTFIQVNEEKFFEIFPMKLGSQWSFESQFDLEEFFNEFTAETIHYETKKVMEELLDMEKDDIDTIDPFLSELKLQIKNYLQLETINVIFNNSTEFCTISKQLEEKFNKICKDLHELYNEFRPIDFKCFEQEFQNKTDYFIQELQALELEYQYYILFVKYKNDVLIEINSTLHLMLYNSQPEYSKNQIYQKIIFFIEKWNLITNEEGLEKSFKKLFTIINENDGKFSLLINQQILKNSLVLKNGDVLGDLLGIKFNQILDQEYAEFLVQLIYKINLKDTFSFFNKSKFEQKILLFFYHDLILVKNRHEIILSFQNMKHIAQNFLILSTIPIKTNDLQKNLICSDLLFEQKLFFYETYLKFLFVHLQSKIDFENFILQELIQEKKEERKKDLEFLRNNFQERGIFSSKKNNLLQTKKSYGLKSSFQNDEEVFHFKLKKTLIQFK